MSTAKSNPFDDIKGLLKALSSAPQNKEGAFRVSTWKMVIESLVELEDRVDNATGMANEALAKTDNVKSSEEIQKEIEQNLKENINASEAETILF